jgi:transcriptional regulator with GAF, ATPase, and Fis domain
VLAATNRDLKQMTTEGKFRQDLYFRVHVFPIHLPPLRERGGDIEHLAADVFRRFARRLGKRIGPLNDECFKRLRGYEWPGNVRELQNVIERAIILTSGPELQLERAMAGFTASPLAGSRAAVPAIDHNIRVLTARELEEFERSNIIRALESCGWRISGESGAARMMGIPPTTLGSRMKALEIRRAAA